MNKRYLIKSNSFYLYNVYKDGMPTTYFIETIEFNTDKDHSIHFKDKEEASKMCQIIQEVLDLTCNIEEIDIEGEQHD